MRAAAAEGAILETIILEEMEGPMATADSIDSVPANAQHEPQPPWFFTGVTTPAARQSTDAGSAAAAAAACAAVARVCVAPRRYPRIARFSSGVRSAAGGFVVFRPLLSTRAAQLLEYNGM